MSEIQPALTPEEWAGILADPYWWEYRGPQQGGWSAAPHITDRHGVAAGALYGQPFGFTHEDVAMLQAVHDARVVEARALGIAYGNPAWVSLIARIAALLPPVP